MAEGKITVDLSLNTELIDYIKSLEKRISELEKKAQLQYITGDSLDATAYSHGD
jgi:hypothetical protein